MKALGANPEIAVRVIVFRIAFWTWLDSCLNHRCSMSVGQAPCDSRSDSCHRFCNENIHRLPIILIFTSWPTWSGTLENPYFFEARKGNQTLYLFGTNHVGIPYRRNPGVRPRDTAKTTSLFN